MLRLNYLKLSILIILAFVLSLLISSCDPTLVEIYTQINPDYSGLRVFDIAVKTEYLQKGEVVLAKDQPLFEKILSILPEGDIETTEENGYTHFKSTQNFNDINFVQHISIDNFSETPPQRFYARMERKDYLFYSEYFFNDYVDMKVDEMLLNSQDENSDFKRIDSLVKADKNLISITYKIKFPVKITKTNADIQNEDNTLVWNIRYGEQRDIYVEGKRTKFLTYFLLVLLGFIVVFMLLIIFVLAFGSKRKPPTRPKKPIYTYDNYFKKDRYFG